MTRLLGRQLLIGLRTLLLLTVILGIGYPLVVLGLAQLTPGRASGSLVTTNGAVVGSSLIGQDFEHADDADRWFWGRPSASDYDGMASGGTNLAADSADLLAAVEDRRAMLAAANGVDPATIPADALTASASGLDPDISPEYARLQVDRVAAARGVDSTAILGLVDAAIENPGLGFVGPPTVDVLTLNLAVDALR